MKYSNKKSEKSKRSVGRNFSKYRTYSKTLGGGGGGERGLGSNGGGMSMHGPIIMFSDFDSIFN